MKQSARKVRHITALESSRQTFIFLIISSEVQNKADILSLIQISENELSEEKTPVGNCQSVTSTPTSVIVKSGHVPECRSPRPVTQLMFSTVKPEITVQTEPGTPEDIGGNTENIFFEELLSNLDQFYPGLEKLAPHAGDECIPIKDFMVFELDEASPKEGREEGDGFLYSDENLMWSNYETPEKKICYPRSERSESSLADPDTETLVWGGETPPGQVSVLEQLQHGAETQRFVKNVVEKVLEDPPEKERENSSLTFDTQAELSHILLDCNMLL